MRRIALGAVLAVALSGCATFKNTPQQDYVHAAFRACERSGENRQIVLDHIEPDGRYWYRFYPGGNNQHAFEDCMAQYRRDHPLLDWLKTQGVAPGPVVAPAAVGMATAVAVQLPITAPVWRIGDEWRYAYKSPS